MQNARKYLVLLLLLLACGPVVWQSEQWGECRVALRELQLFVRRYEREHRVSPKLDNDQLTFEYLNHASWQNTIMNMPRW